MGSSVGSGRRLLPVVRDESGYAVRRLRTLAHPVVDARQIEPQLLLTLAGNGIEKADVLQAQATLALATVCHDDVIKGLIRRPAPCEAYGYHALYLPVQNRVAAREWAGPKKSADSTQRAA